jgi:hypothetical protein
LLSAAAGCDTEAYCFSECEEPSTSSTGGGGGGSPTTTTTTTTTGTGFGGDGGDGGQGGCEPSNGGIEICDQADNDCNGTIDDIVGQDLASPSTCGVCSNNCYTSLANVVPQSVTCDPSPQPGEEPGTCQWTTCADDHFDVDGDDEPNDVLGCEYYCVQQAADDTLCDNKDTDCDGAIDEDVDKCTDASNCGQCGRSCAAPNAITACVKSGNDPTCTTANTQCQITDCQPGWVRLPGSPYGAGCSYQCTATSAFELCGNGLDDDCDGLIDAADPDVTQDPQLGVACTGASTGICALPANQGLTTCVGQAVVCAGPNVKFPGDVAETCNNLDDDCDGTIDDAPNDVGMACGTSSIFPCSKGTLVCQAGGQKVCVGNVEPGIETCNGVDDDCDGTIDDATVDATGACNVPPTPTPPGTPSGCAGGMRACVAGAVVCQGFDGPDSTQDACGIDSNCDGVLTNQPNFQTNAAFCGNCNTNCNANQATTRAIRTCNNGMCQFAGCLPGFYDLNNDQICEYACTPNSPNEICDGVDNDCDGQTDEGVIAPSPVSVCGVSPAATRPECTTGIQVTCNAGTWQCTFPAGVTPNGTNVEVCDMLDNDCDGQLNENVPNFGQSCVSDAGLPFPGHGACRTTGTFVCNGPSATSCSAVKASCTTLAAGCTENCDGVDNDCDGLVDEPFTNKGSGSTEATANFVRPAVGRIGTNLWVYQYEASRPNATSTSLGSGNGYWTSGPTGTTLDRTPACSVPNRIPWINVTPTEVEQTCNAMGGFICSTANWKESCRITQGTGPDCSYGYAPYGLDCRETATPGQEACNLAYFDVNSTLAGVQNALLPTASGLLLDCFAAWGSNGSWDGTPLTGRANLFDITGNIREITRNGTNDYRLMGGAFTTQAESGATCNFDFYSVPATFKFEDTGFRCCFSSNPTQ